MARQETHKIIVKVQSMDGSENLFRISEGTQLWKLMAAYCDGKGMSSSKDVRFLFNGGVLHHYQTPQQVNMKEGDVIDALPIMRGS